MAALYAGIVRVSKMNGRVAGSDRMHSDQEQVTDCQRYATELHGALELLPPELDISGGNPIAKRPSLQAAIEGVEQGKYAGIVVAYLSRLTRSRSGLEIWDRVEAAGGKVLCAQERLDTSTSTGRYIRDIHLANAVREREQKGEDHAKRRAASIAAGIWCTPNVPRGYDKAEDRHLTPNDDAPLVASWFQRRAAGEPILQIARSAGINTATLRATLKNRVYLGEVGEKNQKPCVGAHPPIVDPETWERCQTFKPRPPRSPELAENVLAGLVRCASCGRNMGRGRGTSGGKYVETYRCDSYRTGGGCDQPTTIMVARLVDFIDTHYARPTYGRLKTMAQRDHDLTAYRATLEQARAEERAWVENVPATSPNYGHGLAVREEARAVAEATLAVRVAAIPAADLPDSYDDLSLADRNVWLRSWIGAVRVERVGRGRRVPVADRVEVVERDALADGDGEVVVGPGVA